MNYSILKRIGTGSYGTVFLIQSTNNHKYYALKSINLDYVSLNSDLRRQLHEINILFFNNCPYLLKGIDIFLTKTNKLEIITPYYEGNTLENFINTNRKSNNFINSNVIWDIFIQLCLGIKYLHDNKIIHRDLKPANILLDDKIRPKKVIIIDFGASIILNKNNYDFANTIIGTPYFMCPEQCDYKKYNYKCDIWALGCILYELITLEKPFVAQNISLLNYKISIGKYKEIPNLYYDPNIEVFKKIIKMCLDKNINNRASIYDILNIHEIYLKTTKLNLNFKQLITPIIINNKNISKIELNNYIYSLRAYVKNNDQLEKSNQEKLKLKVNQNYKITDNIDLLINKDILQLSPKNNYLPSINNKLHAINNFDNKKLPSFNKLNKLPSFDNNKLPSIYNNLQLIDNKSDLISNEEKIEIYNLK
jgi:NIMA (never in mitosis gene a)-related kinase